MAVEFSAPRHWEDWLSWLLGIWLALSPWILVFWQDGVATRNAVILGILIIAAEVVTLTAFALWEEWIDVVLGAWLIVSPWILAIGSGVATVNFVVVGAVVIALALYEIWGDRSARTG